MLNYIIYFFVSYFSTFYLVHSLEFYMSRFNYHPLALALLALTNTVVNANTTTDEPVHRLETIVVSASGFKQKITDAPASISVISKEELAQKPYMTLLDAVRELEGVDIGETRDKTGQGSISMRGMGGDYTLLLIDGKRQNNHGDIYPNSFGGNQFNHIPPLSAIERIEVIRGPASTLYGADAMGGVINIITKKVTDEWTGSVTHSRTIEADDYGDDTTTDFTIMGPLIPKKLGLTLRGSLYERDASNPEYADFTDPSGAVGNRSLGFGGGGATVDNENQSFGARLSWTPTDNQSISFDIDRSKQEYDNAETQLGTLDGIDSIWRQNCTTAKPCTRADPRVGYAEEQKFTRDTWSITHEGEWNLGKSFVSLAHVETNNNGRTLPFTVAERNHLLEMLNGTGNYANLSVDERKAIAEKTFLPRPQRILESAQYTFDANLTMPFEYAGAHNVIVGTQIIRGELTDGVFGMEKGQPSGVQDHNMWSLFAEDTWNITNPFALTMGLRYDDHEVFGDNLSPRLYGVYTINDDLTVKGGVSTGFKTPKTTQLYNGITGFGGQGTSPQFGNPDLQPEKSTSSELAIYWNHPAGHNFNATIFHNQFDDKIASQSCGNNTNLACADSGEYASLGYANSSRTVNIDDVVIQGLELAGKWQILDPLSLRANYTYTDSEQKSGENKGKPLGNTAKHMANATLDWKISDQINTFLTAEHRSSRYRGTHAITGESLNYKGYEVFHLGASYKFNDHFTFNGRINNLLDEDFTTYRTEFRDLDKDGKYDGDDETLHFDDYNNKDKGRSFWLSLTYDF